MSKTRAVQMESDSLLVRVELGKQVALLRREIGWTQEELAEKCQISSRTISSIENGVYNLRVETAARVASGLGVPLKRLFQSRR